MPRAELIAATCGFRGGGGALPGARGQKEWLHFCVFAPEVEVLVNYSLMDDLRPGASRFAQVGRVALLVRRTDGSGWDGDLDTPPPEVVRVRRGRIEAEIGRGRLSFVDGAFVLEASLEERPISLAVRLVPETVPLIRPNTPLPSGEIHWLVVPRLRAAGKLVVGPRSYALDGAPAYHDHNWGRFAWGDDFAWQWGYALPAGGSSPFSLVFVRLTSARRTEDLGHGLFLWKDGVQHKTFREGELKVVPRGLLRPGRVAKFPRAMRLVAPEQSTDVPRELHLTARSGADRLECRFSPEDVAQILIPSELSLGTTVINEVVGRLEVEGRVFGEPVGLEGRGFFELLTTQR